MMKKILACVLTLALVLSFAACGQPANIRGDINPNPSTEATTEATTEAATEATTEATTEVTTVATTEAAAEDEFSIGSSAGGTYKNGFIGIQCSLDSNWVFMTDEEMQAVNEATLGVMGDEYKAALANAAVVQDMMATNINQMDTVNVVLEKLGAAYLLLTEEQYLNLAKDSATGGLQSMGFTIEAADVVKIQFAGAEHAALNIEASYAGVAVYECIAVVKCNGYIACITVATWLENTCMDVLNQFEAY